ALDEMSAADQARSFQGASVGRRSLTVAAGPVANFILSAVIFAGIAMWSGVATDRPVIGQIADLPGEEVNLQDGDIVLSVNGTEISEFGEIYEIANDLPDAAPLDLRIDRDGQVQTVTVPYPLPPLVFNVEPLSAASAAGLKPGDLIRSAGGVRLHSFGDLRDAVMGSGGETIPMDVQRGDEVIELTITPREMERLNPDGTIETRVMIGVAGDALVFPQTSTPAPWTALWIGAERVVDVITMSLTGIKHIIVGNLGAENLQGPLGIAQISGESATQGIGNLISLIAVISTAIGMLNLFPIPVLDGGHLLMFGYEALRGRPPAEAVMRVAMTVGLGMVLLLMVFATYNDLMRLALS
ncbi:MAG: RIP metalloprotease RseP, partial [Pseudomonadota bacterium]